MSNNQKKRDDEKFSVSRTRHRFGLSDGDRKTLDALRVFEDEKRGGDRRLEFGDCPKCRSKQTAVVDSRKNLKNLRRRHSCSDCDYRWTTYEIVEADYRKLKGSVHEEKLHELFKNYFHSLPEQKRSELLDEFYS